MIPRNLIIIAISDLHNRRDVLEHILRESADGDVIVFPGDLTHFGSAADTEHILVQARRVVPIVFGVAGNCDNAAVDVALQAMDASLSGRSVRVGEVGFFGVSGIPPWQARMYCFPENDLLTRLNVGATATADCLVRVAVTHVPPYGTKLDRIWLGSHAGSRAVREIVEKERPTLLLCGHIHEAQGIERLGSTQVVNCGAAKAGHFARIELELHAAGTEPRINVEFRRV